MVKYEIKSTSIFGDSGWEELESKDMEDPDVKPLIPLLDNVPKVTFGCYNMGMFTSLRSSIGPVSKDLKSIKGWKKLKRAARRAIRTGTWGDQNWVMECYSTAEDDDPALHIDRMSLRYNDKERDLSPVGRKRKIRKMKDKIKKAKKRGYKHPKEKRKRKIKTAVNLLAKKITLSEEHKMCEICTLIASARDLEKTKGFFSCRWCMDAYEFKPKKGEDLHLSENKNE